jgi:2-oxoglutarate ferredoxin oxidoreductase subunit beta
MKKIAPEMIYKENTYCPGCGHGIVDRLLAEVATELDITHKLIGSVDIACSFITVENFHGDFVLGPHGRMGAVATGMKRARPGNVVIAKCGDGAAYAIGLAETIHAALRNENISMFVVNNCVYGMTGGQMAPTTLAGQITSTTKFGRDYEKHGHIIDGIKMLSDFNIAYLARGAVISVAEIKKTKKLIKKALQKQILNEGFSYVEILSPCPTNWGMTPVKALKHMTNEVLTQFPTGEFID